MGEQMETKLARAAQKRQRYLSALSSFLEKIPKRHAETVVRI